MKKLPREIYPLNGDTIIQKLKDRRDVLAKKQGIKYYNFISDKIKILGSNKQEYFEVTGNDSGIRVKVHARRDYGDTSLLVYDRQFDPKVTDEIRLYGLNGNDQFRIENTVSSRIKIRMIGGKGIDTFDVKGRLKNFVYDLSNEPNYITEGSNTKDRMSKDPAV